MNELLLILVPAIILLVWVEATTKREIALRQSSKLAAQFNLQLLDDSIHCSKLEI
ncbi:MAG: DUF3301 domain-containing protein, partial [Methylophilaceae bacterium]|nr:DUF3301 domain-containing protein [Methylophilaceae bacterium]